MENTEHLQDIEPAAAEQQCHRPGDRWAMPGSWLYWQINLALFLAGLATFSLLYCVQPLLPLLARTFAIGPAQSSLALSLATGSLAVAIVVAGAWSSRVDRRRLMFASMITAAAANLLAALLPDWRALLLARAVVGLCMGGVPAVAMAYLAEQIDPRGLGLSTGLYVAGTAFGGMMGRVGTSALVDSFSWRTALASLSAFDMLVAVGFLCLLPAGLQRGHRSAEGHAGRPPGHFAIWRGHLAQPALRALFACAFLASGFFVTIYNYAGFHLLAAPFYLSLTTISLIFTVYVFGMAGAALAGGLADRFGQPPVLLAGIALAVAGVLTTLSLHLPVVILGVVLLTIGFFTAHATASGWVGRLAHGHKGHASALYLLAYYSGSSVLGSAGGWCWEAGGWTAVVSYVLLLLGALAALAFHLRGLARVLP